ncbi:MAG: nuclease-related domain-containing protein [Chloroflexi bacterium]|nr:nuclease-related domain-containing protein [Chloroflexota bacterium]
MKIVDRTPFRTDTGEIDVMGRVQGTLKYGLSWFARVQAQDKVIAILDKVLGAGFIMLRNITLPDTEIDLPLVLIGPPGIYLINVTHERGVYRAKDEEWGTIVGEKFVPASINQVQRTLKLGRVLQIYLDRAGYKNMLVVDPILMSAEPGMHIESTRPAVRVVMSDALERFGISISQARPALEAKQLSGITHTILEGPKEKAPAAAPAAPSSPATPSSSDREASAESYSSAPQQDSVSSLSAEDFGFSFDEKPQTRQQAVSPRAQAPSQPAARPSNTPSSPPRPPSTSQEIPDFQSFGFQESGFQDTDFHFQDLETQDFESPEVESLIPEPSQALAHSQPFGTEHSVSSPRAENKPKAAPVKKKGLFGLTNAQLIILVVILLCWLCSMALFGGYIYYSLKV